MPKTAGIIATFNQENYVEESVRSLACQVDELIVIDDHSSDRTFEVIRDLNVPNLRLIRNDSNLGVSSACNLGVSETSADVIFFQGGDDVSLPGRVEQQLSELETQDVVLSYGLPEIIDANGYKLPDQAAQEFFPPKPISGVLENLYFSGNFICAPSVAMRRELYLSLGGFNPALKYLQDYELWLKCASLGDFRRSTKTLIKYRKHSNNLSREELVRPIQNATRFDAEMDYVLGSAIGKMGDTAINRLINHIGIGSLCLEGADRRLLVALVQISHANVTQKRRGLSAVFEVIGDLKDISPLAKFGIDQAMIEKYALSSDHRNMVEFAKVTSQITRLSE